MFTVCMVLLHMLIVHSTLEEVMETGLFLGQDG